MSVQFSNPKNNSTFSLDDSISFQGTASSDVTTVKVLAEDKWLLGESDVTGNAWSVGYKFSRSGQRQIIAKGFDAAGKEISRAEIEIDIQSSAITCDQRNELFQIASNSVWQITGQSAFFYKAGMSIDADGAPNAYHPADTGIDFLANAGNPGDWWALVTDSSGNPVTQKTGDPFPGFFISTTALEDTTKDRTDPLRYVDSGKVPYIVLPGNSLIAGTGAKLGDFVAVLNGKNGKFSYAIYADVGPKDELGEGSIALSKALGHNPFIGSKVRSSIDDNILYVVFPGSRKSTTPWSSSESATDIDREAEPHFEAWGGMARIRSCFDEL